MSLAPRKLVVALVVSAFIIAAPVCEAKRALGGSNRKTSGGSYTTKRQPTSVTKPSYNTNSGSSSGNSHADAAKLSYPNYNSQPNRPASAPTSNNQPIGWNVPNNANPGPPPVYSPANVAGGAKTNIHEPPPVYQKPNYGAPPSYNQATGTNYGQPTYHNPGSVPAGAQVYSPNNLPPGATLYNNPAQIPGGYNPAGSSYPMGGSYHAPGSYGGYHAPGGAAPTYYQSPQNLPQGATYVQPGSALPPGAVLYSSPPQQTSSGLGFGSGLAAGAIGGAILGHVLTPTQTKVIEQAPAAAAGGGSSGGSTIVIVDGQVVNTTDANGVVVVNTGTTPAPGAAAAAGETPAPLAPLPAGAAETTANANNTSETPLAPMPAAPAADPATPANATNAEQPPPAGGIICVPVRINETDPSDATKMIEVEKIACYPAPPPPVTPEQQQQATNETVAAVAAAPVEGSAPLAPMQPITAGSSSQQLQQESTMVGDQTLKSADNAAGQTGSLATLICFLLSYLIAYN
ncbi:uncharacterized protein ACRADG_006662 isoform 1-T2 [Cochliomyia hominivorax]